MAQTNINIRMDDDFKKHLKKAIVDLEAGKGQIHELIEVKNEK